MLNVAPNLTWNISNKTQVELEFDYSHNEFYDDYGIPAFGTRPANVSRTLQIGEAFNRNISDSYLVDLDVNHRFNDNWKFTLKSLYAHQNVFMQDIYGFGLNENLANGPVGNFDRFTYFEPNTRRNTWAESGYLTGKINLFNMKHTLLAGADYYNDFIYMPFYGTDLPDINIFNPVHGLIDESQLIDSNAYTDYRSFQRWWSVYLQDQIDISRQLKLLIGGRYDDTGSHVGLVPVNTIHQQRLNPRFGIVYQPLTWLSFYGHYLESLGTNNGRFSDSSQFKPQIAEEYEAGFKAESKDGRFLATLAYFDLTKQNILTPDPINPVFNITAGEARSRGIEFDFTGELIDGLRLIGSYSFLDTRITKDTTRDNNGNFTRLGKHLPNAPEHAGSFWGTYEIQTGMLQGLNFGAGTYIVDARQGDFENSFQMPGYVRLDAMLGYNFKAGKSNISTQINVNNILDKTYFKGSFDNREWILFGDPLTVLGSVRIQF